MGDPVIGSNGSGPADQRQGVRRDFGRLLVGDEVRGVRDHLDRQVVGVVLVPAEELRTHHRVIGTAEDDGGVVSCWSR